MTYRIGVDIGGTFTDFCFYNDVTDDLKTLKVLSTPSTPGREITQRMEIMKNELSIPPSDVIYFTHGHTIGVNTLIQRKGAKLFLFTTENFCDILDLQRLRVPDAYNLIFDSPETSNTQR